MAEDNDKFTIRPCLFIGLGTNGWEILQDLRKFVLEEFGRAGLPCFRYLAIETDKNKEPDNGFIPHNPELYEEIKPLHITVADVEVVKKRLEESDVQDSGFGLKDWLDNRLIERGQKSYEVGAGNLRQAGRLCLWKNWKNKVRRELIESIEAIRGRNNIDAADKFLCEEYFPNKHPNTDLPAKSLVKIQPKVYICGTLCGGTCSGAFIDVAYFVSELLGIRRDSAMMMGGGRPEVIGLFTVMDDVHSKDPKHKVPSVNCWTALRELDFYYQDKSRYQVTFPDGQEINTLDAPFDTVYLQSMQNQENGGFTGDNPSDLRQMCAMNLFTEVVAGLADKKDENRVNLKTTQGYFQPNDKGHMRAFSSFGLSAIWYPRNRISRAINLQLAIKMIDSLLGNSEIDPGKVDDGVQNDWGASYERAQGSLIGTVADAQVNLNLPAEINTLFGSKFAEFSLIEWEMIDNFMAGFPVRSNTLGDRLNSNGDYYRKIDNAKILVAKDLKENIRKIVIRYMNDHTNAETKTYIQGILSKIKTEVAQLPATLSPFPFSSDLVLNKYYISGDFWKRWLRQKQRNWDFFLRIFSKEKRTKVENEYQQYVRNVVWNQWQREANDRLKEIRDHFLHGILAECLLFLEKLSRDIVSQSGRLPLFRDACRTRKGKLLELPSANNLSIITRGEPSSIVDDVELGVAEIMKTHDIKSLRDEFLKGEPLMSILRNQNTDRLVFRVDKTFDQISQAVTDKFQVGKKAISDLKQLNIALLVRSSFPHVEIINGCDLLSLAATQSPNFIFCKDSQAGKELSLLANKEAPGGREFTSEFSPLDHFIFIYREEIGLAISDLVICKYASEQLEKSEANHPVCTNFTHKHGENFFNLQRKESFENLRQWIEFLLDISPDSFEKRGKDFVFVQVIDGLKEHLSIKRKGSLAEEEWREYLEENDEQDLIKQFQEKLRDLGEAEVKQRMNERVDKISDIDEQKKMEKRHRIILEETFKRDEEGKEDSLDKEGGIKEEA